MKWKTQLNSDPGVILCDLINGVILGQITDRKELQTAFAHAHTHTHTRARAAAFVLVLLIIVLVCLAKLLRTLTKKSMFTLDQLLAWEISLALDIVRERVCVCTLGV